MMDEISGKFKQFISHSFDPEDFFESDQLIEWAEDNGFTYD